MSLQRLIVCDNCTKTVDDGMAIPISDSLGIPVGDEIRAAPKHLCFECATVFMWALSKQIAKRTPLVHHNVIEGCPNHLGSTGYCTCSGKTPVRQFHIKINEPRSDLADRMGIPPYTSDKS